MRSMLRVLVLALVIAPLGACASKEGGMRNAPDAPPLPPPGPGAGEIAKGSDAVSSEIKKTVSEQLGCPEEQLNIICTERDRSGECIAVRALGCDKEMEFKFGSD